MAGRKTKLNENKKGNRTLKELNDQQQVENELNQFTPLSKTPPSWLPYKAKTEWKRIIEPLSKLPTSELDRNMLAMYCYNYCLYRDLQKDVSAEGTTIKEETKWDTVEKKNPKFQNLITVQQEIIKLSSQLGMTIDSRMRLIAPEVENRGSILDAFREAD
ncbi:phage terminase small subunit P27 family [Listeria monocytogenes]|uniref:phage terminase small subunit P27 family n=1 Tax=Listeria monocytogenes TaxID=1639 RepID=UPI003F95DD8F